MNELVERNKPHLLFMNTKKCEECGSNVVKTNMCSDRYYLIKCEKSLNDIGSKPGDVFVYDTDKESKKEPLGHQKASCDWKLIIKY